MTSIKKIFQVIDYKISNFIKSIPFLYNTLVTVLDYNTMLIGFLFSHKIRYLSFFLCLFVAPSFYSTEMLEYYTYLYEMGYNVGNICYAVWQFLPFPFILILSTLFFYIFIVSLTTPLLYITCLSDALKLKYGEDILKRRSCNSKLTPAVKLIAGCACLLCGQEIGAGLIAHKMEQQSWVEVAKANPGNIPPQPTYPGGLARAGAGIARVIEAIRR